MNMKPALLVAALVAASVVTVGCEQRGPSDTVGKKMDQAPGKMEAQNAPPGGQAGDSGKMAAPGGTASDKMAAQGAKTADKIGGAADDAAITAKVKPTAAKSAGLSGYIGLGVVFRDNQVIVESIDPNGPAARADVREGDGIVTTGARPGSSEPATGP